MAVIQAFLLVTVTTLTLVVRVERECLSIKARVWRVTSPARIVGHRLGDYFGMLRRCAC